MAAVYPFAFPGKVELDREVKVKRSVRDYETIEIFVQRDVSIALNGRRLESGRVGLYVDTETGVVVYDVAKYEKSLGLG